MACHSSFLPIFLVLLLSLYISSVQSVNFEDLISAKIDHKLEKFCYIPFLDFLCPDPDPEPSVSVEDDDGSLFRLRKRA